VKVIARNLSNRRLRKSTLRILRENVLCSMASVGKHNRAHINTAYFCYSEDLDDLEIYFLSDPRSTHCRNLSANPSMAITIFRSAQKWGESNRGLQLFGTCSETSGQFVRKAERLYGKRFPLYKKWMDSVREDEKRLAKQLRSYRFHRFLPSRVKILDEGEFGAVFITATIRRGME
jgi:uncharacterized protein YhbP (UPF0306 family)